MTEPGDDVLLEAARGGDAGALEALLERYQPRLYRFSRKMCRDPEDARDVLQDSLLAAARGLGGFRGEAAVSTWLYSIARSFCIKKRRRGRFAPAPVSYETEAAGRAREVPDTARGPDQLLEDRQLAAALEQAIAALAPGHREVLVLRDVEGLPASEVAEIMGLGVRAVKSRLHRARGSVRERLAPLLAPRGAVAPPPLAPGCPDIVRLFSRHLEGDIDARTCAEMERHLSGCPRCQAACDSLRHIVALCRGNVADVPAALRESIRTGIRNLLRKQA